jgi:ribonucleoside-triphosphate reductase
VQRLVIQQLWAEGLFDAAEHYQNYREEHRKKPGSPSRSPGGRRPASGGPEALPDRPPVLPVHGKFSRWREEDRRRETWRGGAYERVMPWLRARWPGAKLTEPEWRELSDAMYNLEASPGHAGGADGRAGARPLQRRGVQLRLPPLDDLFAFPEMLYILMQGTGQGFSVETDYVDELPRIKKQRGQEARDDRRRGRHRGLVRLLPQPSSGCGTGYDVWYDTRVRKKERPPQDQGRPGLGPEPFLELLSFTRNLVMARQGRYLEDTDAHRLACFTGRSSRWAASAGRPS